MNIEKLNKRINDRYYLEGGFYIKDNYELKIIENIKNTGMGMYLFSLDVVKGNTEDFIRLRTNTTYPTEAIKNIERKFIDKLKSYMTFKYDSKHNLFWGDLDIDCEDDDVFYEFIELVIEEVFEFCKEELD